MKIEVRNACTDFNSYRAARVKSLFNAESGANFDLDVELPIEDSEWRVGVVVGPSGSGKTSIGQRIFGPEAFYQPEGWKPDQPIVDCIAPEGDFNDVTAALAAVGLGTVPAWLRPYAVLSNGEKFRADLARIISEAPARVVVDEFTSVVDRQIAQVGALAFQKAWRRTGGQAVLLSCHYDILDWLEPDWVFDTRSGEFQRGSLWRRPRLELEILETDSSFWPLFEPHHYLKIPKMVAARYFVGFINGDPVVHLAVSPRLEVSAVRASRMVVMPEWQGAGVGLRFMNAICARETAGEGRFGDRVKAVYFQTSHPGLCAALRRDKNWVQVSAALFGGNKTKSFNSITKSFNSITKGFNSITKGFNSITKSAVADRWKNTFSTGYGGHFRAVQGFKYLPPAEAAA